MEKVHKILRRCEIGKLGMKGTEYSGLKLMPLTDEQSSILKLFDSNYLARIDYLKSIGVKGL